MSKGKVRFEQIEMSLKEYLTLHNLVFSFSWDVASTQYHFYLHECLAQILYFSYLGVQWVSVDLVLNVVVQLLVKLSHEVCSWRNCIYVEHVSYSIVQISHYL